MGGEHLVRRQRADRHAGLEPGGTAARHGRDYDFFDNVVGGPLLGVRDAFSPSADTIVCADAIGD
jgi:hypothetical protein